MRIKIPCRLLKIKCKTATHFTQRKNVFGVIWLPMVRPASALPSPSLDQLCSLRALASTPSPYLVSSYFVWSAPSSEPRASYVVSELGPEPPSPSFGHLRRLWSLSSSAVSGAWQAPVSGPEPAPPSPNLFQLHRRLRVLSSLAVCESWLVPLSPSPDQLRRLRGLEEIRRLRAAFSRSIAQCSSLACYWLLLVINDVVGMTSSHDQWLSCVWHGNSMNALTKPNLT